MVLHPDMDRVPRGRVVRPGGSLDLLLPVPTARQQYRSRPVTELSVSTVRMYLAGALFPDSSVGLTIQLALMLLSLLALAAHGALTVRQDY